MHLERLQITELREIIRSGVDPDAYDYRYDEPKNDDHKIAYFR